MRLIDADKLIQRFKELKGADSLANMFVTDVINEIKKQPTAHDVDKVVDQMKKLASKEYEKESNCDENGFGDGEEIYDDGVTQGKYEAYRKSLEIVKSGGIE